MKACGEIVAQASLPVRNTGRNSPPRRGERGGSLSLCPFASSAVNLSQGGVALALALAATVLASLPYVEPEHTPRDPRAEQPVAVIDFETFHPPDRVGMTVWVEEQPHDSPLVAQYLAGQPLQKVRIVRGEGEARTLRHGAASEWALVRAKGPVTLQFLTYYFPGWRAWVDGVEVPVRPEGPQGLITLEVDAGEHQVLLRFVDTPARQAGLALSAASALAWLAMLAMDGWKHGGVRHALP